MTALIVLSAAGIDAVYVQNYTLDYAQATAREFVEKQLLGELHAGVVVVGEDVRFGKNNAGDGDLLVEFGRELGFDVVLLDDLGDNLGRRWSSTWIRELLELGDVAPVAQILGRAHRLRGGVTWFPTGPRPGFPHRQPQGRVPRGSAGRWRLRRLSWCRTPGTSAVEYLPSAISVGTDPQFDGVERTVEAHVLGRSDLNLYGEHVAVDFVERLRPMLAFNSVQQLLKQMDEDLRNTAVVLGVPTAGRVDPAKVDAE